MLTIRPSRRISRPRIARLAARGELGRTRREIEQRIADLVVGKEPDYAPEPPRRLRPAEKIAEGAKARKAARLFEPYFPDPFDDLP